MSQIPKNYNYNAFTKVLLLRPSFRHFEQLKHVQSFSLLVYKYIIG